MLLATQAFVYNAVIFTFSIVLTKVFKVDSSVAGLYLIPFGIANFLGALLLGRLFDTVGRRIMISATYLVAAAILAVLAVGYWIAAGLMGLAALTEIVFGVDAEQQPLEEIAEPLSAET